MERGERLNGITSLVGAGLAVAALVLLLVVGARTGRPIAVVSFAIFGACLVAAYAASTLYHSVTGRAKRVFRVLDHASIFLLIAGTYTPVALVALGGTLGWTVFGVIWVLAAAGIGLALVPGNRWQRLMVPLFLGMGWLALATASPLMEALGTAGIALVVAGGIAYTSGLVFYAWKRLPHHHGIWHLFVIAGSVCHVLAVLLFVR